MSWTGNHSEIAMDMNADAHGQAHGNLLAGQYWDNPDFTAYMASIGASPPWTYSDAIYAKSHAGPDERSLMAGIEAKLHELRLTGQSDDGPPAPQPEPTLASARVGTAFDNLEVAIGHAGLGDGTAENALGVLDTLMDALNAGARKIRAKLEDGSAWEAAVNCDRLAWQFGVQSRYVGHVMQTYPLSRRDWEAALGLPWSEEGSSDGVNIAGGTR